MKDDKYYIDSVSAPNEGESRWVAVIKGPDEFCMDFNGTHYAPLVKKVEAILETLNESV